MKNYKKIAITLAICLTGGLITGCSDSIVNDNTGLNASLSELKQDVQTAQELTDVLVATSMTGLDYTAQAPAGVNYNKLCTEVAAKIDSDITERSVRWIAGDKTIEDVVWYYRVTAWRSGFKTWASTERFFPYPDWDYDSDYRWEDTKQYSDDPAKVRYTLHAVLNLSKEHHQHCKVDETVLSITKQ